jgi:hypothetical protein
MDADDTAGGITQDATELQVRIRQATELGLRPWRRRQ